jgi:hypothetical protein
MHDTISWSFDLLAPDERHLFTALSVFAGTFDLESAEAVDDGDDTLDVLTRLTERSMLVVRPQQGGVTRYEVLETLREYGRSHLSDERAVELFTTHASHYAAQARSLGEALRGPDEAEAMVRAEAAFADFRSAQRFAAEIGRLDDAFDIIVSLREFAMRAMRYEVFAWADVVCGAVHAHEHPLAPTVTGIRAYGAWVRGNFDEAVSLVEETRALERALGVFPSGLAERVLANVLYTIDQAAAGNAEAMRQVELAADSGDSSRLVHACYMAAVALASDGRYEEAQSLVARAREHAPSTGSPTDLASVAVAEAFSRRVDAEALDAFVRADRIARSAGNRWMSAFARTEASGLLVTRGELEEGCAGLAEMVDVWYRAGDWAQQWHTLSRCVIALDRIGHGELAMELVGAIEAHATLGVAPMSSILLGAGIATRDRLIDDLGDERARELRAAGAARPVEDIVFRTRHALITRA